MGFHHDIAFKEAEVTEEKLLEMGQFYTLMLAKVSGINEELDKFNNSEKNIFDDNQVSVSTRYLDEALEAVQGKLGELALKKAGKKK